MTPQEFLAELARRARAQRPGSNPRDRLVVTLPARLHSDLHKLLSYNATLGGVSLSMADVARAAIDQLIEDARLPKSPKPGALWRPRDPAKDVLMPPEAMCAAMRERLGALPLPERDGFAQAAQFTIHPYVNVDAQDYEWLQDYRERHHLSINGLLSVALAALADYMDVILPYAPLQVARNLQWLRACTGRTMASLGRTAFMLLMDPAVGERAKRPGAD